jgi:hypothetical protein
MTMKRHLITLLLPMLLATLASGAAPAAEVDTLASLQQWVAISKGGDAVLTVTVVLAADGPGSALLPFGFGRADSFTVSGAGAAFPADAGGAPAPLHRAAGRDLLALSVGPEASAGDTVTIRCRLPKFVDLPAARGAFGAYELARTFVNDSELSIGAFRMVLEMPDGYRVRRITGTEPAYKPQVSPVPPGTVGISGGHGFASVVASHLRPGGRARLGIQAERSRRGPVPLVGGVLIVVLYLVFFRRSLVSRRAGEAVSQASTGSR